MRTRLAACQTCYLTSDFPTWTQSRQIRLVWMDSSSSMCHSPCIALPLHAPCLRWALADGIPWAQCCMRSSWPRAPVAAVSTDGPPKASSHGRTRPAPCAWWKPAQVTLAPRNSPLSLEENTDYTEVSEHTLNVLVSLLAPLSILSLWEFAFTLIQSVGVSVFSEVIWCGSNFSAVTARQHFPVVVSQCKRSWIHFYMGSSKKDSGLPT